MSTIKVDNIRIASESVSRPVRGVAAAWANYTGSGGTPDLRNSLNVSSSSEAATGKSSFGLTTPMSGDQTQFSISCSLVSIALNRFVVGDSATTTSSVLGTVRGDPSDGRLISGPFSWSIHGDLA
jgi:hypothetical protein